MAYLAPRIIARHSGPGYDHVPAPGGTILVNRVRRCSGTCSLLLRLVGDMEWALSAGWDEQEVYEYELEYNNTLGHRFPIIGLCQYDVNVFSGQGILDALKSHEDTYQYPIEKFCI